MTAEKKAIDVLGEIQSVLKAPKGQYNSFGKYAYRSCEDILEAVKPLLKERGAVLTISDEIEFIGGRWYVRAIAKFRVGSEAIETSAFAREPEAKKGMDESQITGAASSYARKYALNGMFCIDDTKDADATNTGDDQKKQTATAHAVKPAQTSKKEPTLKERFDACLKYLAGIEDKSLKIGDSKTSGIISRVNDLLEELKTAGRANEYKQLNETVNSKLFKDFEEI